jgi:hypothetical protein
MDPSSSVKGGSRLGAERKVAVTAPGVATAIPKRIRLPVSPLSISCLSSLSTGFAEAWRRALKQCEKG